MQQKTLASIKAVTVLVCIALISALLLGVINYYTWIDPDAFDATEITEQYPDSGVKTVYNGDTLDASAKANSAYGSVVVCAVMEDGAVVILANGIGGYNGGTNQAWTVIKGDGTIFKVTAVKGDQSKDTYSNVYEGASAAAFAAQFAGKNINDFTKIVPKNPAAGEVAIISSGATMSSTGIDNAVNMAIDYAVKAGLLNQTDPREAVVDAIIAAGVTGVTIADLVEDTGKFVYRVGDANADKVSDRPDHRIAYVIDTTGGKQIVVVIDTTANKFIGFAEVGGAALDTAVFTPYSALDVENMNAIADVDAIVAASGTVAENVKEAAQAVVARHNDPDSDNAANRATLKDNSGASDEFVSLNLTGLSGLIISGQKGGTGTILYIGKTNAGIYGIIIQNPIAIADGVGAIGASQLIIYANESTNLVTKIVLLGSPFTGGEVTIGGSIINNPLYGVGFTLTSPYTAGGTINPGTIEAGATATGSVLTDGMKLVVREWSAIKGAALLYP
jgi:hypothetical protein